MVWYLLICTFVNTGSVCLTPQAMPSREACEFIRRGYEPLRKGRNLAISQCRGVRK